MLLLRKSPYRLGPYDALRAGDRVLPTDELCASWAVCDLQALRGSGSGWLPVGDAYSGLAGDTDLAIFRRRLENL